MENALMGKCSEARFSVVKVIWQKFWNCLILKYLL